ncbi:MAG: Hsp70 family protein, partial [Desulfobacterales bacterium]|nr:Hsp70 family protein [Desulfobacterales bacterium]
MEYNNSVMIEHKYIVGIDFGTTNTVVTYTEAGVTENVESPIQTFRMPQLTNQGSVETQDVLPSVLFLPEAYDVSATGLSLPWDQNNDVAVGEFAKKRGGEIPARMVASAKSWLCHSLVDRNSPILPWKGAEEVSKLSPVASCSRILRHIRDAWNHEFAFEGETARLEHQDIYLTVPASFDAVARELTVKAANDAGLSAVTLLEEPQAAFYAWLESHDEDWRENVSKGDLVLVCDIGGGTTDFSLIRISENEGDLDLERIAVGDHLLVGGDNMDLALSYFAANKFQEKGKKLDNSQMSALIYKCRDAKEKLLSDNGITSTPVTV